MSEYNDLAVVFGDFRMWEGRRKIPQKFKDIIVPGRVQHILCTGNIGDRETVDWIHSLASNIHIVKGDLDGDREWAEDRVIEIDGWKIGMIHGHQIRPCGNLESLASIQRRLDVDILIYGNSKVMSVVEQDQNFYISPGSVTGVYSLVNSDAKASFIVLAFGGAHINIFLYQMVDEQMTVSKKTIQKA